MVINKANCDGAYYNISSAGTYQIKIGAGCLKRVVFCSCSNQEISFYDGEELMMHVDGKDILGSFEIDVKFYNGLSAVVEDDFDITVIYT